MNFKFPEQHAGEDVLMVIRKHFIVYLLLLAGFILICILPALLGYFVIDFYDLASKSTTLFLGLMLLIMTYVLYGILFLLVAWINEAFDVFILTNERLIDVTQVTFFERTVATTPLDQIQDTTSNINGIIPTILNYGDINVQTAAGTASDFFIDHIPDPSEVSRVILEEAQRHKKVIYRRAKLAQMGAEVPDSSIAPDSTAPPQNPSLEGDLD